MDWLATARGLLPVRRTVRIGVTGLARSGKTALLTSLAANLLAAGAGLPALPALTARLAGRSFRVSHRAGRRRSALPRFDTSSRTWPRWPRDPPDWPARTQTVSLLALDLEIGQAGLLAALPPQRVRLEVLDYPGEWLLDLPLLGLGFAAWSAARCGGWSSAGEAADFLAFANALPAGRAGRRGAGARPATGSTAPCSTVCATRPGCRCCSPAAS